jgi:hypothetical protein
MALSGVWNECSRIHCVEGKRQVQPIGILVNSAFLSCIGCRERQAQWQDAV